MVNFVISASLCLVRIIWEMVVNRKRFIYSVAAVYVLFVIFDFIVHQKLLSDLYAQSSQVWRAEDDMQMFPMFVSQLLFVLAFVYIFSLNFEHKGVGEGIRYGSYIGFMLAAIDLGTYTYLPIPFTLTLCWMVAVFIKCLLSGMLLSAIYSRL